MNNLERIIKEYLTDVEDVNQIETVEILPLTIADMMIEYHEEELKKILSSSVLPSVCKHPDAYDVKTYLLYCPDCNTYYHEDE